jgi:hypothetical protein
MFFGKSGKKKGREKEERKALSSHVKIGLN